jgi:hypothetical protein
MPFAGCALATSIFGTVFMGSPPAARALPFLVVARRRALRARLSAVTPSR